jgi:hypothetical protein
MRAFIESIYTFFAALIALLIGWKWGVSDKWSYEPLLITALAGLEVLAFVSIKLFGEGKHMTDTDLVSTNSEHDSGISVNQNATNQISINITGSESSSPSIKAVSDIAKSESDKPTLPKPVQGSLTKNEILEHMKKKTFIIFIDDDKGFSIVRILKDHGWTNTHSMVDVKSIDMPQIAKANVLFIDNHGVGKLLKLKDEGLDLVFMIKEKYPEKVVVIYSADSQANMLHEAIDKADHRLSKDATVYQFMKIIESSALKLYSK